MDIYVVGLYKKNKVIQGFKLLALNTDGSVEIKDVAYDIVKNTIQSGKANIVNLKIERGILKGVNGSLDRYGVVGKSQSLVVLKELVDNTGKSLGYLCSDTLGNTRNLTECDVITFAEKLGIANGKIVTAEKGKKHLSSIDGNYGTKLIQQNTKNKQSDKKQSTLPDDVKQLIIKIKDRDEYKGSYASKIVETIEKYDKCSDKQRNALLKEYNKWTGNTEKDLNNEDTFKKNAIPDDIKNKISEIKKEKDYNELYVARVIATVEKMNACSDKQADFINKKYAEIMEKRNKNEANEKPITINNADIAKANEIKNKLERFRTAEDHKRKNEDKKEMLSDRQSNLSKKQKRAILQNIVSDGLLDYSISNRGTVYVEGFSNKAETVDNLDIPSTVCLNGKKYTVSGISIEAFMGESIKTVKTPSTVYDIGQRAFRNCSSLVCADLSMSKHESIASNLFRGCCALSDVKVGNFVKRVHERAFSCCDKLTEIQLPDCTDTIARGAFEHCIKLKTLKHNVKNIDFGAFLQCESLNQFDFSSVLSIGTQAFRRTGLTTVRLTGNTTSVGEKAFADCDLLQFVDIEEGVKEIGDYCFAKTDCPSVPEGNPNNSPLVKLDKLKAPKSLSMIGIDAFRHVGVVVGWTGSVAESKCNAYGTNFEAIDSVNLDNSTRVRVKSQLTNSNPIEALMKVMEEPKPGSGNPELKLNTSKLVNIPFSDSQLKFFNLDRSLENKEPHIKFKAALNYLQDVADLFQDPLTSNVLRLQDTYYVKTDVLYDDTCNKIIKAGYQIMDTLEEGNFILAFMNNSLVYIVDCNLYTDIKMTTSMDEDAEIPIERFLHSGDIIGETSTISGHNGILRTELLTTVNVGKLFYDKIYENGIVVDTTKRDEIVYVPSSGTALNLHDKRADNLDGEQKVKDECKSVIEILNYDKMLKSIKSINKNIGGSKKFFDSLSKLSNYEVSRRIKDIGTIEEEKEAQLFKLSKEFNKIVDSCGNITNPNMLTYNIFKELSDSYWMVHKDFDWLQSTGKKSLNKVSEYHIGKYKLTEYKSNQIVKFSNPYMNGQKGAYVYTLTDNNSTLGVYASRYTMEQIVDKLYDLTHIDSDVEAVELLKDPEKFDLVSPKLFYSFYDVLYSKNGWTFNEYNQYLRSSYGTSFHISMYKPNGIFYLTMERIAAVYNSNHDKIIRTNMVIPILPIGNMDRALMVATTTNTNAKGTALFKELMDLAAYDLSNSNSLRIYSNDIKDRISSVLDNYIQARKLVVSGVKDVSKYKKLIDDRAVYMLGTVHHGKLKREHTYEDIDYSIEDIDIDTEESMDDIDDSDLYFDDDTEIDIELEDDEELDLDDNVEEANISFEEFFETAKSMGITDEGQARVMYMRFINNQ